MIQHINDRLNKWAAWVATGRKVVGLGYPSQAPYMRLTPSSNSLRAPIENEEAWEIEQAIQRLDRQLRDAVEQYYLRAGTAETHAKALCICRDTLYVRIHSAHNAIMEWLQVGDEDVPVKNVFTSSDTLCTKQVR